MQYVLVLDTKHKPLCPCHPARARELLHKGKAAVYRRKLFTIILNREVEASVQPVELRIDPGSRTTGFALAVGNKVVWAMELKHRGGAIRDALLRRRSLRRARRGRKTRYRQVRFANRRRARGWLPPSVESRVKNVSTVVKRLRRWVSVGSIALEHARFDTQALQNPEISGAEYQQGTLFGYEVREYLLEKFNHTCVYCGAKDVPLEIDHVVPRKPRSGLPGTDRVSNLVLACTACNSKKGNMPIEEFLGNRPEVLARIRRQMKAPLQDAAAMNATRYEIGRVLRGMGVPVSFWTGGRTRFNRTSQGLSKQHWIDAACVGERGGRVVLPRGITPLQVEAKGRGKRQVVRTDKYGFPVGKAGRIKRVHGFQTGDVVLLRQPQGKYAGVHHGRLSGVRATGMFDIKTTAGLAITASHTRFSLIQRADGYAYAH